MKWIAVLFCAGGILAQNIITNTTTTAAMSATTGVINLTSVAGISAGTALYVVDQQSARGEMMTAKSNPSGLTVQVTRGQQATPQVAHISGATVYVGSPNWFYSTDAAGACPTTPVTTPWINYVVNHRFTCSGGAWACANCSGGGGSGTVTQVDTGTGLTGGPITASGTIEMSTSQDWSTFILTIPWQVGTSAPGTCTVGEGFFDTDATAGSNIYLCTAPNVYTQLTGGGGGSITINSENGPSFTLAGTANEITATTTTDTVTYSLATSIDLSGKTQVIPMRVNASLPATCAQGALFTWTAAVSGMRLQFCDSTNNWMPVINPIPAWSGVTPGYVLTTDGSNISWDAPSGSGGGFSHNWVAARCQNTVAASNGSIGDFTSGVEPVAACFTGSNRVGAYLAFDDTNDMPVYDQLELPTGSVPTINADFYVTTSGTSTSDATLRIYTGFSTTSQDPAWNAAQNVTFTPAGTANTMVKVTVSGLTTTGATAGGMMNFKIDRDTSDANTEVIRLVNVKFY